MGPPIGGLLYTVSPLIHSNSCMNVHDFRLVALCYHAFTVLVLMLPIFLLSKKTGKDCFCT